MCEQVVFLFAYLREEVIWLNQEGTSHIFPDHYEDYVRPIPKVSLAPGAPLVNRREREIVNQLNSEEAEEIRGVVTAIILTCT